MSDLHSTCTFKAEVPYELCVHVEGQRTLEPQDYLSSARLSPIVFLPKGSPSF